MPVYAVNEVDHYYEWITESTGPTGKPVLVFVHGWAGSLSYWRTTARQLTATHDCLLYDMRGFGQSKARAADPLSPDYALEVFADELALLLTGLGLDTVSMNAHSMGASVAVLFANRHCDRIDKLILTCNGIFEYDKKAFDTFYRFGKYVVAFRPSWLKHIPLAPQIFMARFLYQGIAVSLQKDFMADFLDADHDTALGTIYTSVSKAATEVMPREFAQLQVPTLLISGEFDQITPAALGAAAAALNPQIDYQLMPRTAHFPMLEEPEQYLEIVQRFLGR